VNHGQKHYNDKDNYIYWQHKNFQYLQELKETSRIFPKNVNTTGKLKDIWNEGFRSFSIDIYFDNKGFFQVGYKSRSENVNLDTFLSHIEHDEIQRMKLNLKNFNQSNYQKILKRLSYLDQKFNIKNKTIIESGTTSVLFNTIKKSGWKISFRINENMLYSSKIQNSHIAMQDNTKILSQIKIQDPSILSFNSKIYPFVKKNLESELPQDILYNILDAPELKSIDFKEKVLKNEFYNDNKVDIILTTYQSQFDD
jgi:hypothetical protein